MKRYIIIIIIIITRLIVWSMKLSIPGGTRLSIAYQAAYFVSFFLYLQGTGLGPEAKGRVEPVDAGFINKKREVYSCLYIRCTRELSVVFIYHKK